MFVSTDPTTGDETPVFNSTSTAISLQEALAAIGRFGADPAFLPAIRQALSGTPVGAALGLKKASDEPKGPPPAFPPVRAATAVQMAIFDNWPGGVKADRKPCRYGCAIELWTQPAEDININKMGSYQHKSQCALLDDVNLARMVKKFRTPRIAPIDQGYVDYLESMIEPFRQSGLLVGLINTKIADDVSPYARGTYYHSDQFIIANMRGAEIEHAALCLGVDPDKGQDMLTLAPFDPLDAAGNRHRGNVILQSRLDLCDFSRTWRTNKPD